MKKLYLVDVSSLFFRAYYAIRPLTSPAGLPVNAIYGFLSMVVKLIKDENPEYLVFCYDRKEPSFRKDMYENYKANRSETPEDLAPQIPYIKKLADLLGIPSVEVAGYEADDLIGTLSEIGLKQNFEICIVSGDKDFGQLVKPHVTLLDTMKETRIDSAGVKEKWGIPPEQFIDYLALVGDTSDNIPGVKGIGPKGAQKLLEQFGSLDSIYSRLEEVTNEKLREKLISSKNEAFLSKKLVTICLDAPISAEMEKYRRQAFNTDGLLALFRELNFKNFEKTLLDGTLGSTSASGIATSPGKKEILPEPLPVPVSKEFSVPAEPILTGTWKDLLDQFQIHEPLWVHQNQQGLYFHQGSWIFHLNEEVSLQESPGTLLSRLGKIRWVGYDLKNIFHKLSWPLELRPTIVTDLMQEVYLVKTGDCSDIEKILKQQLGVEISELTPMAEIFSHLHALHSKVEPQDENSKKLLSDLDIPLIDILYKMERRGVKIDLEHFKKFSQELEAEIRKTEKEIHEIAGETFNVASPKQLAVILFQKLGLEATKKTKTGYSTDNDVLEKLNHPIAALLLTFREVTKLKSTYVDPLPEMVNQKTGRIHTVFSQALTTTGRLSSNNPNLQNIPIRTPKGQRVRQGFVAEKGKVLLSVDYSQIELRILAHISDDPNMKKAFVDDLDIHTATAAEIYSLPLKDITPELRRAAKAVNFGIAYGQGAFGLAENLGISRGEAQGIIKRYFEKFRNVQDYMESVVKMAYEKGYVETIEGRRRYMVELKSTNPMLKKFGERAAINAPIQGSASDLVKKAMIEVEKQVSLPMLLQVHDELLFEATEEEVQKELPRIKSIMESVTQLKVPLKVNAAFGLNWDQAH